MYLDFLNMKKDYQDHIDEYLLGRMSEEESKAFEQEIAKNDELREQVEFTRNMQTAVKSRNEKLAKMQKWDKTVDKQEYVRLATNTYKIPAAAAASPHHYIYWISGIAAILVIGFFLFHTSNNEKLYMNRANLSLDDTIIRGGGDFADIKQLLKDGDYQNALIKIVQEEHQLALQRIEADSITDKEHREYDLELIQLKTDELNWLKVHALLGVNRRNDAIELLDQLRKSIGEYRKKADSLFIIINK